MSSLLNVTACGNKIDDINKFLKEHKSGEFKEYADLIKKENNINAQNLKGLGALHQGMCWMGSMMMTEFKLFILFSIFLIYSISGVNRIIFLCFSNTLRRYSLELLNKVLTFFNRQ